MNRAALALLLAAATSACADLPLEERRSGYTFMSPATRAMQDDPLAHPAVFALQEGEALWRAKAGAAGASCSDCHGDAPAGMRGVAARYPRFDTTRGAPVTLAQRIDDCRTGRQRAPVFGPGRPERLALTAYVARQSLGMPVVADADPRALPYRARGRAQYFRRQGALHLACNHCHDLHWGKSLGGSTIPQAHPTGYPIYRLEWQGMGSLERRLRSCLAGVRAEPWADGAIEYVELELYLMWRARGMAMEAPAVRP